MEKTIQTKIPNILSNQIHKINHSAGTCYLRFILLSIVPMRVPSSLMDFLKDTYQFLYFLK